MPRPELGPDEALDIFPRNAPLGLPSGPPENWQLLAAAWRALPAERRGEFSVTAGANFATMAERAQVAGIEWDRARDYGTRKGVPTSAELAETGIRLISYDAILPERMLGKGFPEHGMPLHIHVADPGTADEELIARTRNLDRSGRMATFVIRSSRQYVTTDELYALPHVLPGGLRISVSADANQREWLTETLAKVNPLLQAQGERGIGLGPTPRAFGDKPGKLRELTPPDPIRGSGRSGGGYGLGGAPPARRRSASGIRR